jgi:hypothetical protein
MKLFCVAFLLAAFFWPGCRQTNPSAVPITKADSTSAVVRVGMTLDTAMRILKENGARETLGDWAPPKNQELMGLELPGNRVIIIVYDPKQENRITALELCTNPGVVKGKQNWHAVTEVEAKEQKAPAVPKASQNTTPAGKGIARAHQDMAKGTIRILYYGKPWSADKPLVDDESGLPVEIVKGCVVTEEFVQETDAYNRAMREAAKQERK